MVLLSITPLPDGVLQLDIIAPFHTSGPPLLQFHLDIEQWRTNRTNGIYSFPIPFTEALCCFGGGEAGSGYYDNASAYSNTQVRVYSDGSSRFVSWIAIGA